MLPHGERRVFEQLWSMYPRFQSTLPHGERQNVSSIPPRSRKISIHAPAWGATISRKFGNIWQSKFQSTLPHGERPGNTETINSLKTISIHAPAWGATANMHKFPFASLCKSTKFQINFQIYSYSVNSSHIMSSTNLIISVRTSREFYVRFPFALQKASLFLWTLDLRSHSLYISV